jgi:hypothetical protein
MTATVTIEGKVLGRRKPVLSDWVFTLPIEWQAPREHLYLRDFITRVVLEEVAAFQERQVQQRLIRVLTPDEIEQGAKKGRVAMGGRELDQEVDSHAAVETALQAFEDRLYFVFINGQQQMALDDVIELQPDSQITFLRLVPLAGG